MCRMKSLRLFGSDIFFHFQCRWHGTGRVIEKEYQGEVNGDGRYFFKLLTNDGKAHLVEVDQYTWNAVPYNSYYEKKEA